MAFICDYISTFIFKLLLYLFVVHTNCITLYIKYFRKMLNNVSNLNVKHKAGHLSYAEDPNGYKSLIAQTLSSNDFNSWSISVSSLILYLLVL